MPVAIPHLKRCIPALISVMACGLLMVASATEAAVTVTESPVREAVVRHVMDKLEKAIGPQDAKHASLEIMHIPGAPYEFPEAKSLDEITIHTDSRLETGYTDRTIVKVRLEAPGGRTREVGVSVRILMRKPVWVVKKSIPARTALRKSDLKLETRDVSHGYAHMIATDADLSQYIARVNLQPGEALDARKVSIPPVVRNQQDVRIILSQDNGMTLMVPGIALSDGKIGDTIRVRQTVFQKRYFQARVIDKNRVLVEM